MVANGDAVKLQGVSGGTGMTDRFTGAISASGTGSDADHDGSGDVSITTAAVTSACGTIMPSVPSCEKHAATIAELSLIPSLQEGTGLRSWFGEEDDGLWARVDSGGMRGGDLAVGQGRDSASVFNPGETMGSNSYEVEDVRARFGFEVPLGGSMSIGGNFWFGSTGSDVSSAISAGEISAVGHGFAETARWLTGEGLYADGQVQYAGFTSDIVVDGEAQVAGNEARSLNAAAGVACCLCLGGVTLDPRACLNWSDIEFEDFNDSTLARISLEDGHTLTGLLGDPRVEQRRRTGKFPCQCGPALASRRRDRLERGGCLPL